MRVLSDKPKQVRIAAEDRVGKLSTLAWVVDFQNAIMQKRQLAFDGQRWFVQPSKNARFVQVIEQPIRDYFNKFFKEREHQETQLRSRWLALHML